MLTQTPPTHLTDMQNNPEARRQLAMPDVRHLQLFQAHLEQGHWRSRHIQALAMDDTTRDMFVSIIECTKELSKSRNGNLSQKQMQKLSTRSMLCLCHSTCPEETQGWMRCMRGAAKAFKENVPPPPDDCHAWRKTLERCTQRQATVLLRSALVSVPPLSASIWPETGPAHSNADAESV